ncbi:XRE family transcriptional regulator, partial [Coprococcus eutactus]|nr:XRE family transcriptional regulator [Coprococcus eutactus]
TVKYVVSEINRVLTEELQITTVLYYKCESEERMPTARHIPAIAYALGVSEAALFPWQTFKRDVGMGNQESLIESICA